MRYSLLVTAGFFIFNNLAYSQQSSQFKTDSILLQQLNLNHFKLSDIGGLEKKRSKEHTLSLIHPDNFRKYPFATSRSNTYNMPIYKDVEHRYIRLKKTDTTQHYSLRIIKPD